MNSQKFENNSYCVGGKHRSGTKNITGEVTVNKKLVEKLNYYWKMCGLL